MKTEESRGDFYRLSSRDDRFESESVREASSGLISGSDYHYYSYRKKCLEYVHFCVKSKRAFGLGSNNTDRCDFDDLTSESRDYRHTKAEEDYKSNSSSTEESAGVRVSRSLENNSRRVKEISTRSCESRRKHNGAYFESQKFNRDESLSSRKTVRRIDNFEKEENTRYAKSTTIEETLKMSKSIRSVKIRSTHEPTSINRLEMARVKKCAQILFRDSADDEKRTASEFLCNKDDTRLHAFESACNEISVRVERVTWICKIRITVRRRERFC
ncbi:hypothetical protein TSAR_009264 [Trichomalopsis sarcophagae]|uniref:Uncharacterized protein n=1 Tax=Trichomalopsis sarcophagae TaxID=543379 RepID=A0A232FIF2_9HYME|nr:hypothetical protein TSAR_009264 [Trichomalopsis sarcophagae]